MIVLFRVTILFQSCIESFEGETDVSVSLWSSKYFAYLLNWFRNLSKTPYLLALMAM